MYKLIKGTVDELEGLLNAAVTEGYTQLFREFPPPMRAFDPSGDPPVDVYAFMMKKPDAATLNLPPVPEFAKMMGEYGGVFRDMMVSLGLGDRLGPPGGKAPVLDLVRPPPDGATP